MTNQQIAIREEVGLTKAGLDHTRDQLKLLEDFVKDVLRKDEDYGVIPGTGGKPTLLKPGAANVTAAFNCHAEPVIDSFVLAPGGSLYPGGFVSYEAHVDLVSNHTGLVMARGFGNCNTYEVKYRYRNAKAICPACGQEAIIKGKEEYGGGWLCFKKMGGCGLKWDDGAQEIEGQKIGKVENENPLDQANTIKKMAIKRAEVDAAMRLPGVARFFTQDLEDMQPQPATEESAPPQPARRPAPRATAPTDSHSYRPGDERDFPQPSPTEAVPAPASAVAGTPGSVAELLTRAANELGYTNRAEMFAVLGIKSATEIASPEKLSPAWQKLVTAKEGK